jgi:hypothetical protein
MAGPANEKAGRNTIATPAEEHRDGIVHDDGGLREHVSRELYHFLLLDRDQQIQAIQRLSKSGMSDHTIAAATRLSVEQVRRLLAEPPREAT